MKSLTVRRLPRPPALVWADLGHLAENLLLGSASKICISI